MSYALIDEWLYLSIDGKNEVYGHQEIERDLKLRIKSISATFIDCQTKFIDLKDKSEGYKEALIGSSFNDEYIITKEKISKDLTQVIAAKKDKIQGIYEYLKGINVESLVPYPVAIRAYLRSKGLLVDNKSIIFMDDLKNQAFLTIFEGMLFNSPRRIILRDAKYIFSEIKRSWNSYLSERSIESNETDKTFTLISNNQQWLTEFIEQGFISRENVVHIEDQYVVLTGLSNAKFNIHFALASKILEQRKKELLSRRIRSFIIFILLIVISCGIFQSLYIRKESLIKKNEDLNKRKEIIEKDFENRNQLKLISFLRSQVSIDYSKVYFDFLRSIPSDYLVDHLQFERNLDRKTAFESVIYPLNENVKRMEFSKYGIFSNSKISNLITHKSLGQKIELIINTESKR